MRNLLCVQRLLGNIYTTKVRARSVWTQNNIVNSPYNDINIPNLPVHEYIWENLNKWPDKTAMVCGITDRSFTYHQLYEYSRNIAATLRSHFQIKNGDVIGLIMPNVLEYPVAVLGAIQAGAIVTTINPIYTANEVYNQLMLAKPKVIIGSSENINVVKGAVHMTKTEIPIITVKNQNADLPLKTISFEELMKNDKVDKNILSEVIIQSNDVVLLPYSSGTTGLPKGVQLTNRNVIANFAQREVEGVNHCNEATSQHQDSIMAVLPFYHVYGLLIILLHNLRFGAKLIVLPEFQPTSFINTIKNYRINLLYTAPPMVLFLGSYPEAKKEHLISVDRLLCGAAPLAQSDIRRVLEKFQPDIEFLQMYGLTEVSPIVTCTVRGSRDHTTVGFAVPNSQLRVVDCNDQSLGPCKVGELHIRGPHVMKGYKDNPEATKAAITTDGWFRSGDLVTINSDGAVTILDRIKELIKVKGYQVPPAELEDLLKEHPDILDAAVVGIPHYKKGEVPKAFIVLKEGHKTTATNIKEFVNKNVVEYKRIREVEFVDTLPKNPSGKMLRRLLKNNNNN